MLEPDSEIFMNTFFTEHIWATAPVSKMERFSATGNS